jgi:hypothetical protein
MDVSLIKTGVVKKDEIGQSGIPISFYQSHIAVCMRFCAVFGHEMHKIFRRDVFFEKFSAAKAASGYHRHGCEILSLLQAFFYMMRLNTTI